MGSVGIGFPIPITLSLRHLTVTDLPRVQKGCHFSVTLFMNSSSHFAPTQRSSGHRQYTDEICTSKSGKSIMNKELFLKYFICNTEIRFHFSKHRKKLLSHKSQLKANIRRQFHATQ